MTTSSRALSIALTLLSAPLLAQSAPKEAHKQKSWFVDTNFIYQQGSYLSHQYLQQNSPEFAKQALEELTPWIVRIQVIHSASGDSYASNHGTGTLLEGGKIITAKHVLTESVDPAKGDIKVVITRTDGSIFHAQSIRHGETDWAVLQIDHPEKGHSVYKSPIKLASPVMGETAVFLGYPARLGMDSEGQVQSFNTGTPEQDISASKLLPMPVVATVENIKQLTMVPLAGFPPVGGMSGGPIFNLRGEVIAVQKSISTTTSDATGEVLRYRIKGESSELLNLSPQ